MSSTRQKKKVHKVMHEYKRGTLKSGSGRKVKSRKQAVANCDVRVRAIETPQESRLKTRLKTR